MELKLITIPSLDAYDDDDDDDDGDEAGMMPEWETLTRILPVIPMSPCATPWPQS